MTRTIEVSDKTYEKIKKQLGETSIKDINSFEDFIGKNVFIRTVTYHLWVKWIKL